MKKKLEAGSFIYRVKRSSTRALVNAKLVEQYNERRRKEKEAVLWAAKEGGR